MGSKQDTEDKVNRKRSVFHGKWRSFVGAFVPRYVPNRVVCGVMGLLSVLWRTPKRKIRENRIQNVKILQEKKPGETSRQDGMCPAPGAYIENQPQWDNVCFGRKSTMAYSGCEIFAVYNALVSLGELPGGSDVAELIEVFEKRGAVWAGLFGTSPGAIRRYFLKGRFCVEVCYNRNPQVVNRLGKTSDTMLVMVYNDASDIFQMIHTVNVSKDETGKYYIHNCYCKGASGEYTYAGPFNTLWDAVCRMGGGRAALLWVLGIRKN